MALTDQDVGRNVRELRAERRMTQAALASRVYMARSAISRLENGQRAVTVPELASIAAALGVDLAYLAVPGGTPAITVTTPLIRELPLSPGTARHRSARIPARRLNLSAMLGSISRRCFRKTRSVVKGGLISKAEQNWEQMVRARQESLGRLDVAKYSTNIRIPDARHSPRYGG
ncbi:MAG: helix-turn-helix domain-containing protein [Dehalococcoidia bacterium]|jgi:hypothetical protein|nr:helix-turn-helix domain-containing protein [Dehalococcoidia bacterium]